MGSKWTIHSIGNGGLKTMDTLKRFTSQMSWLTKKPVLKEPMDWNTIVNVASASTSYFYERKITKWIQQKSMHGRQSESQLPKYMKGKANRIRTEHRTQSERFARFSEPNMTSFGRSNRKSYYFQGVKISWNQQCVRVELKMKKEWNWMERSHANGCLR